MSFKYTTDDRPDYIDDLEEAAHLFETGKIILSTTNVRISCVV